MRNERAGGRKRRRFSDIEAGGWKEGKRQEKAVEERREEGQEKDEMEKNGIMEAGVSVLSIAHGRY